MLSLITPAATTILCVSSTPPAEQQQNSAAYDDPTEIVAVAVSCGDAELEAESLKYPTRPASC